MFQIKKFILNMLCLAVILFSFLPMLAYIPKSNLLSFGTNALFLLALFSYAKGNYIKELIVPFITLFFIILFAILGDNKGFRNGYPTYSMAIFIPIVWKYIDVKIKESIVKIFYISLIIIAVICVTTSLACLSDPYASRHVGYDNAESAALAMSGVGDYSFIYGIVFLIFDVALLLFTEKNLFLKILFIAVIALGVITIFLSNFTTALLCLFIGGLLLAFSIGESRGIRKSVIIISGLLVVGFYFLSGHTIDLSGGEGRMAQIFDNSNKSVVGAIMEEFFADRWPYIQCSINGMGNHPILGNAALLNFDNGENKIYWGQHSFALDTFSLFGIIGWIYIYYFFKPLLEKYKIKKIRNVVIAYLISLIIVIFLNNYCYSMLTTLYIFGLYSIERFHEVLMEKKDV